MGIVLQIDTETVTWQSLSGFLLMFPHLLLSGLVSFSPDQDVIDMAKYEVLVCQECGY